MARWNYEVWVKQGTPQMRFCKRLLFNFVLVMLFFTFTYFLIGYPLHWALFDDPPFVSVAFWVKCVGFAFLVEGIEWFQKRRG